MMMNYATALSEAAQHNPDDVVGLGDPEQILREVFAGQQRVLGRMHADTLTTATNLAAVLDARAQRSDAQTARRLYQEAADLWTREFGEGMHSSGNQYLLIFFSNH